MNADIALWTSAFVILTLVVNAPLISTVLNLLKLNKIPGEKLKMRRWVGEGEGEGQGGCVEWGGGGGVRRGGGGV